MHHIIFFLFNLIIEDPCQNDDFSGFTGEKYINVNDWFHKK